MAAESTFVSCVKLREVTIVIYDKAHMAGGSARTKMRAGKHANPLHGRGLRHPADGEL